MIPPAGGFGARSLDPGATPVDAALAAPLAWHQAWKLHALLLAVGVALGLFIAWGDQRRSAVPRPGPDIDLSGTATVFYAIIFSIYALLTTVTVAMIGAKRPRDVALVHASMFALGLGLVGLFLVSIRY